jgi:hypothetical protein
MEVGQGPNWVCSAKGGKWYELKVKISWPAEKENVREDEVVFRSQYKYLNL